MTVIILLGFTFLFAVWVLDIFDTDFTQGNQFVLAFFIAGILVYWRIGRYIVKDDSAYIGIGVLILVAASVYKSRIEKS